VGALIVGAVGLELQRVAAPAGLLVRDALEPELDLDGETAPAGLVDFEGCGVDTCSVMVVVSVFHPLRS